MGSLGSILESNHVKAWGPWAAGGGGHFGLCSQSCGKPLEGFQEGSIAIWLIFYDRSLQLLCGKGTVEGECENREEEREGLFSIPTW